jgi:hypothetical protein
LNATERRIDKLFLEGLGTGVPIEPLAPRRMKITGIPVIARSDATRQSPSLLITLTKLNRGIASLRSQ